MAKVGRNDPCPCGSGKKYKQCHERENQAALSESARAMRLHDLDEVVARRLMRFASERSGDDWLEELYEELDADDDFEPMGQLLGPCALYERATEDGTVAEAFLRSSAKGLTERERGWLDAQRAAWLSVWEVESIVPGVAVVMRDFFTHERRRVLERSGSGAVAPRDGVLARVVDFEGLSVFSGVHPRPLPPRASAAVVSSLRKVAGLTNRKVPVERLREAVPFEGWIFAWQRAAEAVDVRARVPPVLHNTDGDPLLLTKDRFDFAPGDRATVETALGKLSHHEDDNPEGGDGRTFVFQRPGNAMHASWDNTIVGRGVVRPSELVLETNSIRRANDLRQKVELRLGAVIRHRGRDTEDALSLLDRAPRQNQREAKTPEMLEVLKDFKRRHLESWVDTPIPALAGLTPREAAAKPRKRGEVALLLKEMENHEARLPPDERADVSLLWNELGIGETRG